MTDQDRLTAIRARAEQATPGPWDVSHEHTEDGSCTEYPWAIIGPTNVTATPGTGYAKRYGNQVSEVSELGENDVQFIAHARDDIPWLLDRLDTATRELDDVKRQASAFVRDTRADQAAASCNRCGHLESQHETTEYRGDKSRRCVRHLCDPALSRGAMSML